MVPPACLLLAHKADGSTFKFVKDASGKHCVLNVLVEYCKLDLLATEGIILVNSTAGDSGSRCSCCFDSIVIAQLGVRLNVVG